MERLVVTVVHMQGSVCMMVVVRILPMADGM